MPHRDEDHSGSNFVEKLLSSHLMHQLPALADVLAYENDAVIKQYCVEHSEVSHADAHQLFTDLLAWLWLSAKRREQQFTSHMIAPLAHLDAMWHVFILHTRSYVEFCQHYFHRYLHHEVSGEVEVQWNTDELSAYLHQCCDQLGEAWLRRNFASLLSS